MANLHADVITTLQQKKTDGEVAQVTQWVPEIPNTDYGSAGNDSVKKEITEVTFYLTEKDELLSKIDDVNNIAFWEKYVKDGGKFYNTREEIEYLGYGKEPYGEVEEKKIEDTEEEVTEDSEEETKEVAEEDLLPQIIELKNAQDGDLITLDGTIEIELDNGEVGIKIGDKSFILEVTAEVEEQLYVTKSDERVKREELEAKEEEDKTKKEELLNKLKEVFTDEDLEILGIDVEGGEEADTEGE